MLGSKKENRYNAYMKRTDSGIIVKTVDSVTGVESLIKFTSDSIMLPGKKFENDCSKENIRPIVKRSHEANAYINKKKKYVISKRNPAIIKKLSNLRPYLKEIQPNIPDFHVYEDSSSSTLDFENPNVIYVANSKLAKDGVVNLTIPGKLGNVCYHGVLNENGNVNFKAKSVIKPFTIVIGDYVINVNICHNLTPVKDTKIPNQLKNKDDSNLTNSSKENVKPLNNEETTDVREADVESKNYKDKFNEFTQECRIQVNDENAVVADASCVVLERSNETVKSPRDVKTEGEKVSELLTDDSESTQNPKPTPTELVAGDSSAESSLEKIERSPSVDLSINKATSLSDQSSENNIEAKDLHHYICDSQIQNVKSCESCKSLENKSSIRDCLSLTSSSHEFPNSYNMEQSCFSTDSNVNGFDSNSLSIHNNLESKPRVKFDNASLAYNTEEVKDKIANSGCSNTSLLEIKKKLSEATTSLQNLCSVIESLERFSEKSSQETLGVIQIDSVCDELNKIIQKSSNEADSYSSTSVIKNRLDENCSHNENNGKCYTGLQNESKVYHSGVCENVIQATGEEVAILEEIDDSSSVTYTSRNTEQSKSRTESLCERNTFCEINYILPLSNKIEQKNAISKEKAGNKVSLLGKRQVQSLTDLSDSITSCTDNNYKRDRTSNSHFINYQEKRTPKVLFRKIYVNSLQAGESQNGKIGILSTGKIKERPAIMGDSVRFPQQFHNDNVSSLSDERRRNYMKYNNQDDSGTNLGQETQTSDPRINSHSMNSIKTIYMKSGCISPISSNNLTMPVQNSSMRLFNDNKDTNEVNTNDIYFTHIKPSCKDKSSKSSFSQKIKQQFSKLKTQLSSFGALNNRKEPDLTQLLENTKCNALEMVSNSNNITVKNAENLAYFAGNPESSLRDFNDDVAKENSHEVRGRKTGPCCNYCSRILSDVRIKATYTTNSTETRSKISPMKNQIDEKSRLDSNEIEPTHVSLKYSDVSFSK